MKENVWNVCKNLFVSLAIVFAVTAGLTVTAKAGGDSFATAEPIAFEQRYEVNFETSGKGQYYTFVTDANPGWYSVNFGKSGGERKYFDVYATPDFSSPVLQNWYLTNDNNMSTVLSLSPNTKYYIYIVPRNEKVGGTANFTMRKINDDFGNDIATGTPLTLGHQVSGNIEVGKKGECDTFTFTTTGNNSYYEVALADTGSSYVETRIYAGPDTSYDSYGFYVTPGNTSTDVRKLEKNRTYYVKVYGKYDEATSYKFVVREIKDDAGDDFNVATTVKLGKSVSKTIQTKQDVDFYKIKTSKKLKKYQLIFKNKSTSGMYVTVFSNPDIASAIPQVKNYYVAGAKKTVLWLTLKANRNYYIKVTGSQNSSYTLQMTDLKSVVKKSAPAGFKASGSNSYFSKYVSLSWKHKYNNASYEIWRSTSPNSGFKKIKTVNNTGYYTDYSVKRKQTYYYKIRYMVKENGKVCKAKWSKTKKAKTVR